MQVVVEASKQEQGQLVYRLKAVKRVSAEETDGQITRKAQLSWLDGRVAATRYEVFLCEPACESMGS